MAASDVFDAMAERTSQVVNGKQQSAAPLRYIVVGVALIALYFILSPVYYFLQGVLTPMQYEEVRRPSATMPIPLTKFRKTLLDKADNRPSYNVTYDRQYMFDAFVTDGGTKIAFLSPVLENVAGSSRPTKGVWQCNWGRGFVTEGHSKDDTSGAEKSQVLQVWCDIPTAAQRVLKSSSYLNVILKRSAGEVARYAIVITAPRLDPKPATLAFCTHLSLQKLTAQIDPSMIRAMLTEWIEYHSMLGVEHFYVYADARPELDDSSGAFRLLQQYVEEGVVTLVDWTVRYMLPQRSGNDKRWSEVLMANDCKLRFGEDAEWMAIGTPKDYLVPSLRHERVDEFLAEMDPAGNKACALGLATLAHFLPPSVDNAHLVKSEEGTQANLILSRFPWVSKNFVPFAKGDGPVIVRPRNVAFIQLQGAVCLDSMQQVVLLEPNCVPGSTSTSLHHCGLHAEDFRAITGNRFTKKGSWDKAKGGEEGIQLHPIMRFRPKLAARLDRQTRAGYLGPPGLATRTPDTSLWTPPAPLSSSTTSVVEEDTSVVAAATQAIGNIGRTASPPPAGVVDTVRSSLFAAMSSHKTPPPKVPSSSADLPDDFWQQYKQLQDIQLAILMANRDAPYHPEHVAGSGTKLK